MDGWANVGLVLAGSAGPLLIALVNLRSTRRLEAMRWQRDDQSHTQELYAKFVAACTQIVADWADFAHLPPRSEDEEREMDARRDVHYADLNTVAAMVRLNAPPQVVVEAEAVLASVRLAQTSARTAARTAGQRGGGDEAWPTVEEAFATARAKFVEAARVASRKIVAAA